MLNHQRVYPNPKKGSNLDPWIAVVPAHCEGRAVTLAEAQHLDETPETEVGEVGEMKGKRNIGTSSGLIGKSTIKRPFSVGMFVKTRGYNQ